MGLPRAVKRGTEAKNATARNKRSVDKNFGEAGEISKHKKPGDTQ